MGKTYMQTHMHIRRLFLWLRLHVVIKELRYTGFARSSKFFVVDSNLASLENHIPLVIDSKHFDCVDLLSRQLSPVSDHFLFALIHT